MAPHEDAAAPELADLQRARLAHPHSHLTQLDETVDHRTDGVLVGLPGRVGEEEGRAAEQLGEDLQLVDELLLLDVSLVAGSADDESVDDEEGGPVLLHDLLEHAQQPGEPVCFERLVGRQVLERVADASSVEEREVLDRREQPRVRSRPGG